MNCYLNILTLTTINWRPDLLGFLDILRKKMEFVKAHAWSARTRRTLTSEAKAFKEFAELAGFDSLPLSGEDLCVYAIWLWCMRGLKSPKSIRMYLSAVRTLHTRLGSDCATPTTYGPLNNVISGLKRILQHKTKKMKPITPIILRNLLSSLPPTPFCRTEIQTLTTFRALTLLLFQTMLRTSNMIPENRHNYDAR